MKAMQNLYGVNMFAFRRCSRALVGASMLGLAAFSVAQTLAQPKLQALITERVDQHKQAVGIAAFTLDEKGVQFAVHGSQSATKAIAITPDTLFEIGSISKTFTGLLLAELVVKGIVKLDDPVEKYLPDAMTLRDRGNAPIQLIDLATHRAGLPRLPPDFAPRVEANPYADFDEKALINSLKVLSGDKTLPRRDTRHDYSNLGFGLLGYALGRADGSNYTAALQKRILTPLSLSATFSTVPESERSRFSDGHDEKLKTVPHWDFDALAGAGTLRMSVRDLARYASAALGIEKTPLTDAFALAMRLHAKTEREANTIGLAWIRGKLNEREFLNHDGGTFGFSSTLWLDTTRKQASGVIANAFVPVNDIGLHALEPSVPPRDLAIKSQTSIALTAAQLAEFAGIYKLSPAMNVAITVRGNQIFAQTTAQSEFELFAKSPRSFFAKIAPIAIEFGEAKEGKAQSFMLLQGGQKMPAPRLE